MSAVIRKVVAARFPEEVIALLTSVAFTIIAALLIAALYFGREIFVPLALAILLSFVLAPVAGALQRLKVPRGLAVVGVVFLAFIAIFGLGSLVAQQLTQLAGDLPRYEATMREKIKSVRGATASSGTLERAADMLQELGKELDKPKDAKSKDTAPPVGTPMAAPVKPVPVEVRQPDPGALESIRTLIAPLLHPLTTTGIIIIFVNLHPASERGFAKSSDQAAGSHDLQRTTAALDDAAGRLSRLFLIQPLLNSAFGLIIGVGLSLIGVPSAIL